MPSLYIVLYGLISIMAIVTLFKNKWDNYFYIIGIVVMTLFLSLRFGQGTDYPAYYAIYSFAEKALNPAYGISYYFEVSHGEIGWKFLMIILQMLKIDYPIFMLILSIFIMWCTHRFIWKFCTKYRVIALVLIYPTIYLTYYFSAVRQGVVMAVFWGILLNCLLQKKYWIYLSGVLVLSTIHTASVIFLIIPIVIKLKKRMLVLGFVVCVMFAIAMILEPVRNLIEQVALMMGVDSGYFSKFSVSYSALLERTVMFIIVAGVYFCNKRKGNDEKILFNIYCIGYMLYLCFMFNYFIASRMGIMFRMAEIVLIPLLYENTKNNIKKVSFVLMFGISTFMMYKNLNYYASQTYKEGISGWNYPYVTMFNQSDILDYRREYIDEKYEFEEHEYID